MSSPAPFPVAAAGTDFDEASAAVVDYLKATLPMGFWAVTRYDGERQLYLEVRDDAYGLAAGGSHRWEDSFCVNMVKGEAPQIAPDAMAVPVYATAGVASAIDIGAYIGIPINRPDGELFGTLCGLDPHKQGPELVAHAPLLQLLSVLLSTILEADLLRTEQVRKLEWAELAAETDPMTGLLNRRGWDRYMELEEARYQRFGDPGGVIVIDLDGLKEVNDNGGHAAGDRYIRAAGQALEASVRTGDVAARLGGDEFGVIAGDLGPDGFDLLVQRILASFDAVGVAGSIGHAPYTVVAGFPGAFASADAAMYVEKARRRGANPRRIPAPAA
jgi:diguanylate cyclase (GGDEF)-like protein